MPTVLLISEDGETAQIWSYVLGRRSIDTVLLVTFDEESTERRPEHSHDLIMIDVHTRQMKVAHLIQRLRAETTVPILLLLPDDDETRILDAYDGGADEVILKPITPRRLLAKITAWMRRSWTVPASMLDSFQAGDLHLDTAHRQLVTASGKAIRLTSLEFRLLHLLMSHPGQVLESSLIIDRVWGASGGGDNTVLKNVVYRLRRKIEPDPSTPRYIQVVAGEGYMFIPSASP
jgi:DNA-binding response OmpR family regulator